MRKKRLLFICTANQQRSPTAEELFSDSEKYEAKSAGEFALLGTQITQDLIDWADVIFVMSEKRDGHLSFLRKHFNVKGKEIYDLDIPDMYIRNDPKLIELLIKKLSSHIAVEKGEKLVK